MKRRSLLEAVRISDARMAYRHRAVRALQRAKAPPAEIRRACDSLQQAIGEGWWLIYLVRTGRHN